MIDWYKLINYDDFIALDLVSHAIEMTFTFGVQEVIIFKGISVCVLFDDVFLSLNLNDQNPYTFDNHLLYIDDANDIWLGVYVAN